MQCQNTSDAGGNADVYWSGPVHCRGPGGELPQGVGLMLVWLLS